MKIIILQPVDSEVAFQHYFNTIINPVDVNRIKGYVSQDEYNSLIELYRDRKVHVWGVTPGTNEVNVRKWDIIKPGDIALFSGKGKIFASAVVSFKIHSKDLSLDLWGTVEEGKTREYIYLLGEVTNQNISYVEFNKIVGYAPNNVIRGFNLLDEQKSRLIIDAFNLEVNAVSDIEGLETSDTAGDTESQDEQVSEEESKGEVADTEDVEASDTKSEEDVQKEQASEEESESAVSEIEGLETSDSKGDIESQEDQVSEEEPKGSVTDIEDLETSNSKIDTEAQAKHRFLRNIIIIIIVTLISLLIIKAIGYFIRSDKQQIQQKEIKKKLSEETIDMQEASLPELLVGNKGFDFRKTKWEMTREQVKAIESMKITDENGTGILYTGKFAGMEATTYYSFVKGKLVGSMYRFIEKHADDNKYISDYKKIKDILTQIYGPPITDGQLWSNEMYKDYPQEWGLALSSGDLSLRSNWETETTEIGLGLYSDDYEIIHGIFYASKKFKHLLKEEGSKLKNPGEFFLGRLRDIRRTD